MSLLEIRSLAIRYGASKAVADISLSVAPGESVGLVGESGSGKSQTALGVLGLLPATATVSGSIQFGGAELLGSGDRQLNRLRGTRIGMVFQDPALNPRQSRSHTRGHRYSPVRNADDEIADAELAEFADLLAPQDVQLFSRPR